MRTVSTPLFSAYRSHTAVSDRTSQLSGREALSSTGHSADRVEIRFGQGGGALAPLFDSLAKRAQYVHNHGGTPTLRDENLSALMTAIEESDAPVLTAFYAEKIRPLKEPNSTLPKISTKVLAAISQRAVDLGVDLDAQAERHTLQKTVATSLGKLDLPGRDGKYFENASLHELRTEAARLSELAGLREKILKLQVEMDEPLDEDLQRSTDLVRLKVALHALTHELPIKAEERPQPQQSPTVAPANRSLL